MFCAGDGARALRIAEKCGIKNIVLAECSPAMVAPAAGRKIWNVRAEEMGDQLGSNDIGDCENFDVITCLWTRWDTCADLKIEFAPCGQ